MNDANIIKDIFNSVAKFDEDNEEEYSKCAELILVMILSTSKCKRSKRNFPSMYVYEWQSGDTFKEKMKRKCTLCKRWYS